MDKLKYVKLENPDGSYSDNIPLAVDSDYVDVNGKSLTSTLDILATKTEVQAVASGSPAGIYATVAALTTADPDHSKIYVVSADGHWYYYNSGWQDGGVYQARLETENYNLLNKKMDTISENVDVVLHTSKIDGYRLTSDTGALYAQSGYSTSDYIPVKDMYKIRIRGLSLTFTAGNSFLCFYQEDYIFISSIDLRAYGDYVNRCIYPNNTAYIRFCCPTSDIDNINNVTIEMKSLANRRLCALEGELLNELDFINNFYRAIPTNKNIGETIDWEHPEYTVNYQYFVLDCNAGDIIQIKGAGGNNPRLWAFIDEDNKLLSKSSGYATGEYTLEVPENAVKIICNFSSSTSTQFDTFYLYRIPKTELDPDIEERFDVLYNGTNLIANLSPLNQNIKTNFNVGETVSLNPESVSGWSYFIIDCNSNDEFIISGQGGTNPRLWAFIDNDNKLLSKSEMELSANNVRIIAPINTAKLICNFNMTASIPRSLYRDNELSLNLLNNKVNDIDTRLSLKYDFPALNPVDFCTACVRGTKLSKEIANTITDFKKDGDLMVHVSTFKIINDNIYVTYYANRTNSGEDPSHHIVRFVTASLNNLENKTYYDLQNVGDTFDGKTVTAIYDTILMTLDDDNIMIMWTAQLNGVYTRLYQIYNITNGTFGNINYNYFKVNNGNAVIFNTTNMKNEFASQNINHKPITIDIGIMQKLSSREENDTTYYYTGCYAGEFNCIIKSSDLITWEYVSAPTFNDHSLFENACYVVNDKVYYFIRQNWQYDYGLLSYYDLNSNTWAEPVKINDAQSRSDFIVYNNSLLLIHACRNRNHISLTNIDKQYINKSFQWSDALVNDCFYPYVDIYNNELYMTYTQSRKHIYLSKITLGESTQNIIDKIYNQMYSNN